MYDNFKAKLLFSKLLSRPNIEKAYKMVGPEDSWYNTIKTVHDSLAEIQKLPHHNLHIKSHDGLDLCGVYYPAAEKSDRTVICIHGFGSHAEREWAFPGLFYHSLGFNLLIPYQRAHGPSEGKRISFGIFEAQDMYEWIKRINKLTPDGKILLHGLSMGGGIALQMSATDMTGVKCIIADAPSEGLDYFYSRVSSDVFGASGKGVAECAMASFKKETGLDPLDFNAKKIVKNSKYPVLLSAGSMEKLEDSFNEIASLNPCETEIVILEGCNHGNGMYKQTEVYQDKIKDFISKYM